MTAAIQLDIFGVLEDVAQDRPPLCLYRSQTRGLHARGAEFAAWQEEHGRFASVLRAHAWHPGAFGDADSPTSRCQASVLSVDLRPDASYPMACDCTRANALLYRGACRHCDFEGTPRDGENPAAEDALDHAWPGWRDFPVVAPVPGDPKAKPRWTGELAQAYPPEWLEAGGPIRTWRQGLGTRHVPGRTPWGGYDAGVPETAKPGTRKAKAAA
jgi:Family of unknown function (DUF6349)